MHHIPHAHHLHANPRPATATKTSTSPNRTTRFNIRTSPHYNSPLASIYPHTPPHKIHGEAFLEPPHDLPTIPQSVFALIQIPHHIPGQPSPANPAPKQHPNTIHAPPLHPPQC